MTKIAHVIESAAPSYGGPATSVPMLVSHLRFLGLSAEIFSVDALAEANPLIEELGVPWTKTGMIGPKKIRYSGALIRTIQRTRPELVHLHNLWNFVAFGAGIAARSLGIPIIVSPRSGLYRQSVQNRAIAKKVASILFQQRLLSRSVCIHVTSEDELIEVRKFGYRGPVAVLPNLFLPPVATQKFLDAETCPSQPYTVLFLSRVHPRKRVLEMVEGYAKFSALLAQKNTNCRLIIAGMSEDDYCQSVRELVQRLGIKSEVEFYDFVSGEIKRKLLDNSSVFVLLSDFENFGMSIAEALCSGIPVVCSRGCPWPDLEANGSGRQIDASAEALCGALADVWADYGHRSPQIRANTSGYVNSKFDQRSIAECYCELYAWALGESAKPDFLQL